MAINSKTNGVALPKVDLDRPKQCEVPGILSILHVPAGAIARDFDRSELSKHIRSFISFESTDLRNVDHVIYVKRKKENASCKIFWPIKLL